MLFMIMLVVLGCCNVVAFIYRGVVVIVVAVTVIVVVYTAVVCGSRCVVVVC